MSSLTRRMQRTKARSKAAADRPAAKPQTILMGDTPYEGTNPRIRKMFTRALVGGYVTVRYTLGALRVSASRLMAQGMLANLRHSADMQQMASRARRGVPVNRSDLPGWRKSIWPAEKVARRAPKDSTQPKSVRPSRAKKAAA